MKKILFVFGLSFLLAGSCKKTGDGKTCWKVPDTASPALPWVTVCDKAENEIQTQYGLYYYQADEPLFCWYLTSGSNFQFIQDYPESLVNRLYPNYSKVKAACDYCAFWYSRIKRTYKPSGNFLYTNVRQELLCADTAKSMYQGRQIILKNTTDSLVVQQISKDGITW